MLRDSSAYLISHQFYGRDDNYRAPDATLEQVENVILNGGMDCDGISRFEWVDAVMCDDTPYELLDYILKNKHLDAIKPMYKIIANTISGILDKEEL
jgi:hypothetical protein